MAVRLNLLQRRARACALLALALLQLQATCYTTTKNIPALSPNTIPAAVAQSDLQLLWHCVEGHVTIKQHKYICKNNHASQCARKTATIQCILAWLRSPRMTLEPSARPHRQQSNGVNRPHAQALNRPHAQAFLQPMDCHPTPLPHLNSYYCAHAQPPPPLRLTACDAPQFFPPTPSGLADLHWQGGAHCGTSQCELVAA
jgi:hypothetical protein